MTLFKRPPEPKPVPEETVVVDREGGRVVLCVNAKYDRQQMVGFAKRINHATAEIS